MNPSNIASYRPIPTSVKMNIIQENILMKRKMLLKETPQMLGYLMLFYGVISIGIPARLGASKEIIFESAKSSLAFGIISGVMLLVVGTILLTPYSIMKTKVIGFQKASSLTLIAGFRLGGICGIPLALWDVYKIILPISTINQSAKDQAENWILWIIVAALIAGWFAGKAIGGIIGLLSGLINGLYQSSRLHA